MLLRLKFDPVLLYTEILAVLSVLGDLLSKVDVQSLYAQKGYQTENYVFNSSTLQLNWQQANLFCNTLRMDLFATTTDMKIRELLSNFQVENGSTWTQYYESLGTKVMVDNDQYPPRATVNDTTMKIVTHTVPDHHAVIVKINSENETVLDVLEKSQLANVVCMGKIPFPSKKSDVEKINNIRLQMLQNLNNTKELVRVNLERMRRELLGYQNLGNWTQLEGLVNQTKIVNVNVDSVIVGLLSETVNQTVVPFVELYQKIGSCSDITTLGVWEGNMQRMIPVLLDLIDEILENPVGQLPWENRQDIDPTILENGQPKMAVSEHEDKKYFLVQLFKRNDQKVLPFHFAPLGNFSYLNVGDAEFYEMTLWDLLLATLGISYGLIMFAIRTFVKIKRARNLDAIRSKILVRKTSLQLPTSMSKNNTRRPSNVQISPTPFHERFCEANPDNEKFHKHTYGRRPKNMPPLHGSTTVYFVKNDDVPLHLADSMLSLNE
jgi:hypothetical protein